MKYSRFTYELLLAISFGIIDVAIDIFETGYLIGKKPEYRWNYPRFQGMEKTKMFKKLYSLSAQGLIEKKENKYYLTSRGRTKFIELDVYLSLNLSKNLSWKGVWYLIMFDIPLNCRKDRDRIRQILLNANFIKLQQSVYVYPHNFKEEFMKIKILFPERQMIIIETKSTEITKLVFSRFKENKIIS